MMSRKEEDIRALIGSAPLEDLDYPIPSTDHSDHVVYLAMKGHTRLAADHILHREMKGHLLDVIGGVIRRLNLIFRRVMVEGSLEGDEKRGILSCARAYDVLIQIALNLIGFESRIVGFSREEAEKAVNMIIQTLDDWEMMERRLNDEEKAPIAKAMIDKLLSEMKLVMSRFYRPPGSMVSHIADEIEKELDMNRVATSFIMAAKRKIRENVYYRMADAGICKFGNDYALGLRWLRHLGFVQVSTNPVLAAVAYDDDPSLWEGYRGESLCPDFRSIVKENPEWFENPEAYGDEIAAKGTEVSIWPNLVVFRPIAIASDMYHGMVSLQLNPKIADDFERSFKEALGIYMDAENFLRRYDQYLLWGYSEVSEVGRPNMVFKVSGSSPVAIDLTRELESLGIGTNNTVTFTVSQEVRLILAKMEGRAKAVKRGIHLTTVYETNMGGRLDDHIREVQAERLLLRALRRVGDKEEALRRLAERLGAMDDVKGKASFMEKVRAVCSRRYLRPINKEPFIDLLAEVGVLGDSREEVSERLSRLEEDIGYCGIYVTKRVYEIFFHPKNRVKWLAYLQSKYGLTREEAEEVMRGIDILPASKRKPIDTLEALSGTNMTNTEFPNHQMNVLIRSREADFNLEDYIESVLKEPDPNIIRRLTEEWDIRDEFVGSYELTPYLIERLKEAGIEDAEKYGDRGLKPDEWGSLGATEKTMSEFSSSYDKFRDRCIDFVYKVANEEKLS